MAEISKIFFSGKDISANVPTARVFIFGNLHHFPDYSIGSNSTRKAVRFAPYFAVISPSNPHISWGWGVRETIDNCITVIYKVLLAPLSMPWA